MTRTLDHLDDLGEHGRPLAPEATGSRRRRMVATIFMIAVGATGLVITAGAVRLGLGSLRAPGPGLWPAGIGAAMMAVAVHLLVVERHTSVEAFTAGSWKVPVGLLSLVVFGVALAAFGLLAPVFALMVLWLTVLEGERLTLSFAVAAATAVGLHLLFVTALGVPFPADLVLRTVGLDAG